MDAGDIYLYIVLIILFILSAFFSSAETALTAVNRHRLRALSEEGNEKASLVLSILEDQPKMLTANLIGNNIVNLSASALTAVIATRLGGRFTVAIGTGILTFLILLFGEITPKTVASIHSERISLRFAPAIKICMVVLTPLIFLINMLSRGLLFILRINPDDREEAMTEDELRTIVEVSHEEGVIESDEKEMINNVFDFGDSQAKDVMVPRVDVVFADVESTYEELIALFREERFTRLPVFEDNPDHIIGIINMKDLVLFRQGSAFSVRDFLREAYFTHEFKNTTELFHEMRKNRVTMSIVLDEYGTTVGIITMEDIVEEIVGEIRDEYDEQELLELVHVRDNEYVVEGSYKLDDINDALDTELESEDYDSIGGYLIGLLDHFPKQGEEFTTEDGFRLIAEKVDHNRIEKIRMFLPVKKEDSENEKEDAV